MPSPALRLSALAFVLAAACSSPSSSTPASPDTTAAPEPSPADTSVATAAPTEKPKSEPTEACPEIKSRFEKELSAAPGTCKADADCDCFPGTVATGFVCGGMTDKATAEKLREIFREFRANKCRGPNCAAQACVPKCKDGRCVEG
ncbi:MAG: hypothetical protein HOV80_25340 [Polyangiaceae bacterium]|nr:hypothetical protein [Polyangiaceae bacterium]